jgi:hypothetical protein
MTKTKYLLALSIPALAAFAGLASAQSLSLTYKLDANEEAQRSSIANAGCAGFRWIASVGSCGQQEALGRYSRTQQGEENVSRFFAPVEKPVSTLKATDPIPYLGESTRPAVAETRAQGDPEFNLKVGDRFRVREDIERRFTDAAQDARFHRNAINALGFELMVPLHSKIRQSADPALPE